MGLTSENLVGYVRAEFDKASRRRIWLFFLQFAIALPAAVSVVVPDDHRVTLYVLAISGALLLGIWWVVNASYTRVRNAAQAARRAALLLGGLDEPLSPAAIQSLYERFTVGAEIAHRFEKADYYETQLPPGPGRLGEMLEESAFYSERLQGISADAMRWVLLFFLVVFILIALATTPFIGRDSLFVAIRVFLAVLVFALSSDVLGAYQAHRAAAADIKDVRNRLMAADGRGYPRADVLLALSDYNTAVESAPESVPWAYTRKARELDAGWRQYQNNRAEERAVRTAP